MGEACCAHNHSQDHHRADSGYRKILWAVLGINAAMFAAEAGAGLAAGSASLQADALDFLGDAGNYATSLFVVGLAVLALQGAALVLRQSRTELGRAAAVSPAE